MLTDEKIAFIHNGTPGVALAFVIGDDALHNLALTKENADIFLKFNNAIDVSKDYPDHNGMTISLFKDNEYLTDFQTSEYFGSILLSNPVVINLASHSYGAYVFSPNTKFINKKFITLDRNTLNKDEFLPQFMSKEARDSVCATSCQCYKLP